MLFTTFSSWSYHPYLVAYFLIFQASEGVASTNSFPVAPTPNNTLANTPSSISTKFSNISEGFGVPSLPVCKGAMLGFGLHRLSCQGAWQSIPRSQDPRVFADRTSSIPDAVILPRRWSSVDGTCVVDVFHKDNVHEDLATMQIISQAAEQVYAYCIMTGGPPSAPSQGGYIRDIGFLTLADILTHTIPGRQGNLAIAISRYDPNVICYGSRRAFRDAGQDLLAMIPVSPEQQNFGPAGERDVQVELPARFLIPRPSSRYNVQATVDMSDRSVVTGSWLALWAAAVAINTMCVARGFAGISLLSNGLSMSLDKPAPALDGSNDTATS